MRIDPELRAIRSRFLKKAILRVLLRPRLLAQLWWKIRLANSSIEATASASLRMLDCSVGQLALALRGTRKQIRELEQDHSERDELLVQFMIEDLRYHERQILRLHDRHEMRRQLEPQQRP